MEGPARGEIEQALLFPVDLFVYLKMYPPEYCMYCILLVQTDLKDKFIQITFWIFRKMMDYSVSGVGITN